MISIGKCGAWWCGLLVWLASFAAMAGSPAEDLAQADKMIYSGDLVTGMQKVKGLAEAGYAPAQARYGEILDKAEHDKEAVEWYRKAAMQGDPAGEFGLGMAYANGEGIAKDLQQALQWVTRSAEHNHLRAMQALAGAYRVGSFGLQPDAAQAEHWATKARALGAVIPVPSPSPSPTNKASGK